MLLTLNGKKVNILKRGNEYRYTYNVHFDADVYNVSFGMLIKTISGNALGGATTAPNVFEGISQIERNSTAQVEFRFFCIFNPGTYFLNAGVLGTMNHEEIFLHRILALQRNLWFF